MELLLIKIIVGMLSGIAAYLIREITIMKDKLNETYSKKETNDMIELRQEVTREKIDNIKEGQDEIKTDLKEIKAELCKINNK